MLLPSLVVSVALHSGLAQNPAGRSSVRYERGGSASVPAVAREMLVAPGTALQVRLNETVDTRRSRPGDVFTANVVSSVVREGVTVIPAGARAYGRVVEAQASGRFKGRAMVALRLEGVEVRGQRYNLHTSVVSRSTTGQKKRNFTLIGGGTGLGAAIGAIAGGGAGALIGAGAGAAAGTVGQVIAGRKQMRIPVETALSFRLRQPVMVRIS